MLQFSKPYRSRGLLKDSERVTKCYSKHQWLHPGILNDHTHPLSTFFLLSLESYLRNVMDVLVRNVSFVFVLFHDLVLSFLRFPGLSP